METRDIVDIVCSIGDDIAEVYADRESRGEDIDCVYVAIGEHYAKIHLCNIEKMSKCIMGESVSITGDMMFKCHGIPVIASMGNQVRVIDLMRKSKAN